MLEEKYRELYESFIDNDLINWNVVFTDNLCTFKAYQTVMGQIPEAAKPSILRHSDISQPITNISWYHAIAFCNALSFRMGKKPYYGFNEGYVVCGIEIPRSVVVLGGNGYRLPTKQDWYNLVSKAQYDCNMCIQDTQMLLEKLEFPEDYTEMCLEYSLKRGVCLRSPSDKLKLRITKKEKLYEQIKLFVKDCEIDFDVMRMDLGFRVCWNNI